MQSTDTNAISSVAVSSGVEGAGNKYEVESKIDAPKGEEHPYIKPCEIG
jgi:hypothetical protein